MMKNRWLLTAAVLILITALMAGNPPEVLAQNQKGILIVTDSADRGITQRVEALKRYLVHFRQKYGYNASSLPILVYDYNNDTARKYCQKQLKINEEDVLFLGVVVVRGQVPLKVHMKVVDPKNLEHNARGVVLKAIGAKAEAATASIVKISSKPAGARVVVDGKEYGVTPITLQSLKPGRHVVVLTLKDKRWSGEVMADAKNPAEFFHNFTATTGTPVPPPTGIPVPDTPTPDPTFEPVQEAFVPKSESNSAFRVTVTNIEEAYSIKDYYKPKPGYKFMIIYVSQQNISGELQVYSGKLSLVDNTNTSYEHIENLSNFWLVVLKPSGMITGYLVYEIPKDIQPVKIVLHGLNMAPLSVNLQ